MYFEKTFIFPITFSQCENKVEKIFKEEESTEILKILGLIQDI